MILSLAAGAAPVNTGPRCPVMVEASTWPCSNSGATSPNVCPRCSVHSPTAKICGSERLHVVIDDDPAAHFETRAARPSSALGLMPAAITTRSASSSSPEAKRSPSTRPLPNSAAVCCGSSTRMPRLFDLALQILAAGRIQLALHQRVHQVDDGDFAAAHLQAARGFQAQQSAADDRRFQPWTRFAPAARAYRRACGTRGRSSCRRRGSEE